MTSAEPSSILVATTDPQAASWVRETLEEAGLTADSVSTRTAFLQALEQRSPQLALIDARIPDGFEWCGAIPRKLGSHARHELSTPVVILCDPSEVARVREVQAIDCIFHPLMKESFLHRLRHVLHGLRTQRELEESRLALASTQRLTSVGTWEISLARDTIRCSEEARRIFGWSEPESRARKTADLFSIVHESQVARLRDWLGRARCSSESAPIELQISIPRAASGAQESASGSSCGECPSRDVRMHIDRVEVHDGRPARVWGLVHDVTSSPILAAPTAAAADLDGLTGLPNQQQFLEHIERSIARAQPPHDQVAVLCVSLDFGLALHDAPATHQLCLATQTQRMRACIRDRDTMCHIGSRVSEVSLAHLSTDEFAILLPGFLRSQDAYKVALRIQDALAQPIPIEGTSFTARTSIGISVFPSDSSGPDSLLKASKTAMQTARQPGQNGVQFFTASMNASAFERLTLEADLRKAIEREELLVYYQPKVELATGNIVGVEALVRWQHPEFGLVSPAQFIPIAEETGLIIPIGEFVLRIACAQNRRWQDQGLRPIRMAVNLSTVQFRDPDLHETVMRTLRTTGLAPEYLELELTESVLLHKADSTIATLNHLKAMGVHLAIDDFGTGYSSLSYLKRFPIHSLKIDQSFIREVMTNPDDAAITTSIILMGRSLKLKVVAEGVESPMQLAFLRVLECDEAQGYLFSRPVPADEVAKLFSKNFAVAQPR
jgi:diguanylate cyclase (GGDEF)-like protein